jgi:hypothetical protein
MSFRSFRGLAPIALSGLLISAFWPATAASAIDDSNIPGVPLPGPVVTGLLGGPIYDHVYAIDVPPGRVIVLTLTGGPGTAFGLYLFNGRATTVYGTAGQVAVSALPGSSQTIRYPTRTGGRFYVDVNGASEVQGPFRLIVMIGADTTPPQVSISLGGGAVATMSQVVRVTLGASDDLSGVAAMQFSADGRTWLDWQPYVSSIPWTFPPGDGAKRLWARVRDVAGNVSSVVSASIALDTTAPLVVLRSPPPGGTTVGLQPTFSVTFSEPMNVVSWLDVGLLVQDPAGTLIHGAYAWDSATNSGTFVPGVSLIPGGVWSRWEP